MTVLPCPECGAETLHGENTEVVVGDGEFSFGGKPAVRKTAARECPDCGHVFAL